MTFIDKVHIMKEYWQQWVNNWLNSSSAPMIGTPTLKVHQEVIEAKDHMTQALVLIGGVHQDLQVLKVQATMILLQELRVMGHNMTQLQELRNKA